MTSSSADVIDRYVREFEREIGRTKAQVLAKIKQCDIANLRCSEIKSPQLVEFARSLKVQPQTRANYLSHLAAVFRVARPLWGHPLDLQQIQDAMVAMRKLGTIAKGNSRERRPTLEELNRLMEHFEKVLAHRPTLGADGEDHCLCNFLNPPPGRNHPHYVGRLQQSRKAECGFAI